jgi:hypothetical protein
VQQTLVTRGQGCCDLRCGSGMCCPCGCEFAMRGQCGCDFAMRGACKLPPCHKPVAQGPHTAAVAAVLAAHFKASSSRNSTGRTSSVAAALAAHRKSWPHWARVAKCRRSSRAPPASDFCRQADTAALSTTLGLIMFCSRVMSA